MFFSELTSYLDLCRSQSCVGSSLPPYKVGNVNSKLFLSEIAKREKSLKRTLEGRISNAFKSCSLRP